MLDWLVTSLGQASQTLPRSPDKRSYYYDESKCIKNSSGHGSGFFPCFSPFPFPAASQLSSHDLCMIHPLNRVLVEEVREQS